MVIKSTKRYQRIVLPVGLKLDVIKIRSFSNSSFLDISISKRDLLSLKIRLKINFYEFISALSIMGKGCIAIFVLNCRRQLIESYDESGISYNVQNNLII